jgi:flagellar biogenesis protein FliO
VGFINSLSIELFAGIGFLVAGIYLMRKFVKDRKNDSLRFDKKK